MFLQIELVLVLLLWSVRLRPKLAWRGILVRAGSPKNATRRMMKTPKGFIAEPDDY